MIGAGIIILERRIILNLKKHIFPALLFFLMLFNLCTFTAFAASTSRPATPKYFQYTALGDKAVTLKWQIVEESDGYEIARYDSSIKNYRLIRTIWYKTSTKVQITGLTPGKSYKFRIRSVKKLKNGKKIYSSYSNPVTITDVEFPDEVKAIRDPYYTVKVKTAVTVKNKTKNTTQKLKKGTHLTVTSKTGTTVTGYLKNGNVVTLSRSALTYTGLDSSTSNDYSTAVKEKFVNLKGLQSSTEWLIWVSEYKLRVNIFKGSRGKWKLQRSAICASGKWSTRTASGIRKILQKIYYGEYGAPYIFFSPGTANGGTAENPMGCAFHNLVDKNYGVSVSHGCVRLKPDDLYYIYNNCPVGTTVYVY